MSPAGIVSFLHFHAFHFLFVSHSLARISNMLKRVFNLLPDLIVYNWRRKWQPTPVLLPGKSHGRRSLVGYSPWDHKESDMTERLHFHFSLSCIGEGNGNPLQCSCLENPRDGGAWWAAVYGVTQSQTQLTQLSSSSSGSSIVYNIMLKKILNLFPDLIVSHH